MQSEQNAADLRLADLLGAFSLVADLGFGLPPQESMRACLIACALGREMGATEDEVRDAFYVALLEHIGCVSMSHETAAFGNELTITHAIAQTNLSDPLDLFRTTLPLATRGLSPLRKTRTALSLITAGKSFGRLYDTASCEVGRETARRFGLPSSTQTALYQCAESWSGDSAPQKLKGDEIVVAARIARTAAEAAVFDDLGGEDAAVAAVRARSGKHLDPDICAAFIAKASSILGEAEGDPRARILEAEPSPPVRVPASHLSAVAAALGDAVDLKSPFFHGHSAEVGELAYKLASDLGLGIETGTRTRVAALLHDIGRVGITDLVWEKPGALTAAEWEQVRMHPYHSERILATSPTLESLARLAGGHHERLDGSGYHRSAKGEEIPIEARVIAVVDAYSAMTHVRPHRAALAPEAAVEQLRASAHAGELDPEIVEVFVDAPASSRMRRRAWPKGLSDREVEVLRLLANGCSNPEIASRLGISRRTAEHHVQHIYSKLGVSTRPGAAIFALEHQLLAR